MSESVHYWTSEIDGLCIKTTITPLENGYNKVSTEVVPEGVPYESAQQ